jgi:hypothetical protein
LAFLEGLVHVEADGHRRCLRGRTRLLGGRARRVRWRADGLCGNGLGCPWGHLGAS